MRAPTKIIKLITGCLRALISQSEYEIKKGYISRKQNDHHDDTSYTDEYQKEVYLTVKRLMIENGLSKVIDFGCGSGFKLINYLGEFDTTGVEISPTINFLQKTYPDRKWINGDDLGKIDLSADVIVSSDVIEHVPDPDKFLKSVLKVKGFKYFVVSTPDRDLVGGWADYGPPHNTCHIREWNGREFKRFVSRYFKVTSHQITNYTDGTQMLICERK